MKIISFGLAAVLAVLLLAAAAILLLVDPNDYRDEITAAVQDATGRELSIEGDLRLSVFPWLGLSLGKTRLSNAAVFVKNGGEKDFARMASVDINVKLMPLLQQRIEMKTLSLRGLRVNLSRATDGRTNWDDLLATSAEEAEQPATKPPEKTPATAVAALAIGGLSIEDAQIVWDDQQTGQRVEVNKFFLRTGPVALGVPIDIFLRTQLSVSEPALQTPIVVKGHLMLDSQAQVYRLDGLDLSLNMQSKLLPVSPMSVGLTGNVRADLAQQQLQLTALQLQVLGINSSAEISVQKILSVPQAEGQMSVAPFSPRELTKKLGIKLPASADNKALNQAELTLNFSGSTNALAVKKLDLVLDNSHLTGSLQVNDFSKPALRFALKLDGIDVDRYLPPATNAPPPSPAGAATVAAQLPLDQLRALDMKGEMRVGKLKLANARLTDVLLGMTAKGGKIQMSPLQAKLYQGQYRGRVSLDVRKDTPKISADEKLSGVQIGPLLKDVLGEDKLSGTANLAAKVTAVGVTPEAITQSLNGTANFSFANGAVKGVNLGQMIREAYAKFKKKPAPAKTTNQTDFVETSGSATIRNGIVHNQDLQASSPALRVAGKGTVDLPKQRINYLLNASIVETDQGQDGKDVSELKALTIPVKITGSFDKPKFKLDLAPVLKARAKAKLRKEKAKIKIQAKRKLENKKTDAKKKLEEKLKDKLKGLFR